MILTLFAAWASPVETPPALRVGTYLYPRYDRSVALAPLAALVERASGRPAEVRLLDTPEALAKALCRGEIDIAMTNLGAFVEARSCPDVRPIAVLSTPPAVLDRYRGVLLVRRDSGLSSLDALGARTGDLRYTEVLPGSTSGALVQAAALRSTGRVPAFATRRHAGTHEAALAELLAGRTDVAALAEGPWRQLQADDPAAAATLLQIWRSDPLPPGPLVCRDQASVPCAAVHRALLADGGEVAIALSKGWSETEGAVRFGVYDPARYDPFRAEPPLP